MKTLELKTTNKAEAIKAINKFRLSNKNQWYQIKLEAGEFTYLLKCFGTWVQIFYKLKGDVLQVSDASCMDIKPAEFKAFLEVSID